MTAWQLGGWGVLLFTLVRFYPREFWPKLRSDSGYQHLALATIVALSFLWSVQAGIKEGLNLHLLLITTLVLSHGWRITVLICCIPALVLVAIGKMPLADVGMFSVTTFILPALFSYGMFLLSYRYMPRNLFIYIFVAGFIAAALTMVLHLLLTSVWFYLEGRYEWRIIYDNYLLLALLMWFPEALLNGAAVTLMSIYRPHWLRTFYDNEYLGPGK